MNARLENWRKNPYRLLFPLGGVLLAWGIAPWLGFGFGLSSYRSTFHAVVQIEGFLATFALGFLFTFIPRRTGAAPPTTVELLIAAVGPFAIAASAWLERWTVSQLIWLGLIAMLLRFMVRRLRASVRERGPDPRLLWVPIALVAGAVGALLMLLGPRLGIFWLHPVGQGLLTQGMFTGLAVGIGQLLFPMVAHAGPPRPATPEDRWLQPLLALAFFATFPLEAFAPMRFAFGLRAFLVLALVVAGLDGMKWPRRPGLHRKLLWLSGWMIPTGYLVVAVRPALRLLGLHLVFVGGFALMVLAVSTHVVLAHGAHVRMLHGSSRRLIGATGLWAVALVARSLVVLDPARFTLWLTLASACFLAGATLWIALLVSKLDPLPEAQRHT